MNNNPQDKPIHVEVTYATVKPNGSIQGKTLYLYVYSLRVTLESARELDISFSTYNNTPQEILRVLNNTLVDMERIETERQQLAKEINSLLLLTDVAEIAEDVRNKLRQL